MVTDELRAIHDLLVEAKAPESEHGPANCGVCAERAGLTPVHQEGHVSTYTKEQLDAAVAEATGPLQAQLAELEKAQTAEQIAAQIAEAVTPLNDKIAELEAASDTLTAELNTVKAERDELVQANTDREAAAAAEAEKAARRDERVSKVLEVASFTEEQVAERADRWADMDDTSFDTLIEDLKAQATPPGPGEVVPRPVLKAHESAKATGGLSSAMTTALGFRRQGIKTV